MGANTAKPGAPNIEKLGALEKESAVSMSNRLLQLDAVVCGRLEAAGRSNSPLRRLRAFGLFGRFALARRSRCMPRFVPNNRAFELLGRLFV